MPLPEQARLDDAIAHLPTSSGIYQIQNKVSGKCYVGKAVNLRARLGQHLRELKAGSHHSPALKAAWAKYQECDWAIVILEECSLEQLTARETFWASETGALIAGYNCAPIQAGVDVTPAFRDQRREAAHKYHARVTDEDRSQAALKAWDTIRRRNPPEEPGGPDL